MHRKSICAALAILSAATLTTSLAYGATITGLPASAPADRSVGKLEQVHAFYDAMPTGVTVTETGRIFVNFLVGATRCLLRWARFVKAKLLPTRIWRSTTRIRRTPATG
ncbi:hypothetical protein PSE10C_47370 [Pseudomonas amygdali pv. eriobotryae]|nr:hypothetical protein PSE10C_47370 [Pseudomonas amygdali pv. eriobotryae]